MSSATPYAQRLTQLRAHMRQAHVDYFLVPAADPHQNEYVPAHWQRRQWLCGFTGSAGDLLVTADQAILWTDSRYTLQAQQELDAEHFQLADSFTGGMSGLEHWLMQQPSDFVLAVDPKLISAQKIQHLLPLLEQQQARLYLVHDNWVDALWTDRPPLPLTPLEVFPLSYAGEDTASKLSRVRARLQQRGVDALVVSQLDAIAWLFNLRGRDIPHNPCFIAYAFVTQHSAELFVDPQQLTPAVRAYLESQHITAHPYTQFAPFLQNQDGSVWLDPKQTSLWVEKQLSHAALYFSPSPITHFKAIKNPTELAGMQQAHVIDALAMLRFLYWLETQWREGVTELSAARQLDAFRRAHPECVDLSFTTISGFAAHGAIVHYAVDEHSDVKIDDSSLYLVDSGGQYYHGTTDVTRTLHLGEPTPQQRYHYTLVLQGHLDLRALIFPAGTCGEHINAIAHAPLWREGLDYAHGTGHGVGHFACVHEFPPAISPRITQEPLQPGMAVSNEPGLYFTGEYGIRIENVVMVTPVPTAADSATGHGPFYGFQDLTLVPYCRRLIDVARLTDSQLSAVNTYHQRIYATLAPLLEEAPLAQWLKEQTAPLQRF